MTAQDPLSKREALYRIAPLPITFKVMFATADLSNSNISEIYLTCVYQQNHTWAITLTVTTELENCSCERSVAVAYAKRS